MFPYFYPKSSFPGPTTRLHSVPTDASSLDGLVSQTFLMWPWQFCDKVSRTWPGSSTLCPSVGFFWVDWRPGPWEGKLQEEGPHSQQHPSSVCSNITFHTGKGGSATHMGYSNRSSPARKSFRQSFSSERGTTSFPEYVGSTPIVWCSFA